MPTPFFLTGFEQGVLSANGGGLCNAITGSATVQGTTKRTGNYALQVAVSGSAATSYVTFNQVGSNVIVGTIYFRWTTNLSTAVSILQAQILTGSAPAIFFDPADQTIYPKIGSTAGSKSAALTQNQWYRIDFKFSCAANPTTVDVQLDGTAITQLTLAQATSTLGYVYVGFFSAATGEVYYDDMYLSATAGDYPIGALEVVVLTPDSDGTHNAGTNVIEANDGTDIGTTTAYDKINSIPPSATTYIKQVSTGTGNYFEVNLSSMPTGTPIGLLGGLAYQSAATQTNQFATGAWDGTNFLAIYGNPTTRADYSETSLYYKTAILSLSPLTKTNVDALKIRGGYSGDINPVPYCVDVWVEVAYASSGLSGTVNQTSETDSVQAIAKVKTKAVGQNTETDTPQTIMPQRARAIGQNTETDLAQAVVHVKRIAVAQVSEADSADSITRLVPHIDVPVLQVTETDTSQPSARQKVKTVGQNTETDLAQAVARQKIKAIGQNSEADSVQAVVHQKSKTTGINSETDVAQALVHQKARAVGLNSEADSAQAIGRVKIKAVAQVTETDEAQPIASSGMAMVNQVVETDSVQGITSRKIKILNQASETDISQAIVAQKFILVLQATETDEAQGVKHYFVLSVRQVNETDLAQAILPMKRLLVGQAVELDLAQMLAGLIVYGCAELSTSLNEVATLTDYSIWVAELTDTNYESAEVTEKPLC